MYAYVVKRRAKGKPLSFSEVGWWGLVRNKRQLRKKLERIQALEKKSELTDVMQAEIILIEYILGTRDDFL